MTKCYEHEECEFNGQPECRLPDGMECPHGVKADKPVAESWLDIEAQIEKLNQYSQSLIAYQMGVEFADVCMDVAAALSTLQAENERLRKELEYEREHANAYHEECGQWEAENEKLRAELERVKEERDAVVESIPHECKTCVYHTVFFNGCTLDHDCTNPDGGCSNNYDRWRWRGRKED